MSTTNVSRQSAEVMLLAVSVVIIKLLAALIILRFFIVSINRIDGSSMSPTLTSGQLAVYSKIDYAFKNPERFDIVEIINPINKSDFLTKRVVGLPGETLIFKNGKIFLSESTSTNSTLQEITEPYLEKNILTSVGANYEYHAISAGKNQYIVLGDNRSHSSVDSRLFGPINRSQIIGKLLTTIP